MKKKVLSLILAGAACVSLAACGGAATTQETTTTTKVQSEDIDVVSICQVIYDDKDVGHIEIAGLADYSDMQKLYGYENESMKDKLFIVFAIDNYYGGELRIYSRDLGVDSTMVSTDGVMIIEPGEQINDFITLSYDELPVKDKKDIQFLTFMLSLSNDQGGHIADTDVKQYEFKSGVYIQEYLN